jgi:hypothetical protein
MIHWLMNGRFARTLVHLGLLSALLWPSAGYAQDEADRCGYLPLAVVQKRDAVRAAATAQDYQALARLADPQEFVYSIGGAGDPVTYWQGLKTEGVDIPQIIVALLDMPCAVLNYDSGTEYVWPSASEIPYAELTPDEIDALQAIYNGKLTDNYLEGTETGYYVGWRLFIAEDGRWTTFVAGD